MITRRKMRSFRSGKDTKRSQIEPHLGLLGEHAADLYWDRRAEKLQERHVIIEDVRYCTSPWVRLSHVQVLRPMAVELVKEDVPEFEQTAENDEAGGEPEFRRDADFPFVFCD